MNNIDKSYVIVYFYRDVMFILGSNDQAAMKILTNKFDIKDFNVADFIL
jgi:hypothetical protein